MTGFATKLSDGAFLSPLTGLRLPARDYVVGEYVLGVSDAFSIKNRANPALPMTVQGAPTYGSTYARVRPGTSGYGFETNIAPDENSTLIVVRKNFTSLFGVMWAVQGAVSVVNRNDQNFGKTGEVADDQGASRTAPAAGSVFFEAIVQDYANNQLGVGGFGKMYWYNAGVQQVAISGAGAANAHHVPYTTTKIGGTALASSNPGQTVDISFVAIINKALTPAEVDKAYRAIVAYYAPLGVTVI